MGQVLRFSDTEQPRSEQRLYRCLHRDCTWVGSRFQRERHFYVAHFVRIHGIDLNANFAPVERQ